MNKKNKKQGDIYIQCQFRPEGNHDKCDLPKLIDYQSYLD